MDIQVGDRVTFDNGVVQVLNTENAIEQAIGSVVKIIKIERPQWSVVEENKELLTEEERAFLKAYLKFMELDKDDVKFKREYNKISFLFDDGSGYVFEVDIDKFCNMENKHVYTPKELRIGGINNAISKRSKSRIIF